MTHHTRVRCEQCEGFHTPQDQDVYTDLVVRFPAATEAMLDETSYGLTGLTPRNACYPSKSDLILRHAGYQRAPAWVHKRFRTGAASDNARALGLVEVANGALYWPRAAGLVAVAVLERFPGRVSDAMLGLTLYALENPPGYRALLQAVETLAELSHPARTRVSWGDKCWPLVRAAIWPVLPPEDEATPCGPGVPTKTT